MNFRMSYFKILFLALLPGLCISDSKGNIALNAVAVQSSLGHSQGDAHHAVDGNKDSDFRKNSCTMTKAEFSPWWRVDLGHLYSIHSVSITNRGDCCRHRLKGAQIRVGYTLDNNGNDHELVATILTGFNGTKTFSFAPVYGLYVNIFLPGNDEILTLCEVEVFAVEESPYSCVSRNLALGAKAVQSSTYMSAGAQKAVDGNRSPNFNNGSCSQTDWNKDPWWRVDLLYSFKITRVRITNRGDGSAERIKGTQIRIGNSLENNGNDNVLVMMVNSILPGATTAFVFKPVKGRYVNLITRGRTDYLSLCEVEVFAD